MWSGKEVEMRPIIIKLQSAFKISHKDDESFSNVGLQVSQDENFNVLICQTSYANSIQAIVLDPLRMKTTFAPLSSDETTKLRGALGQLNWLSNMTRPDVSFMVSKLSANVTTATVANIKEANKLIKYIKETPSQLKFPSFDSSSVRPIGFTDASFNNHDDGGSQGGHIIFLTDM